MKKKTYLLLSLMLSAGTLGLFGGCGTTDTSISSAAESAQSSSESSAEEPTAAELDYDDVKAFESALNSGDNLEGKTVQFKVNKLEPQSAFGYNLITGEHLNFVSSENPNAKEGDLVTVKVKQVQSMLGSWLIQYDMISVSKQDDSSDSDSLNSESEAEMTTNSEDQGDSSNTESTNGESEAETTAGDESYEHNQYYDIETTATITNSIGHTIVIHKVQAKQDASISASMLAYASDGSVVGKSTNDIVLTKGESNYIQFYFDGDISNADLQPQYKVEKDSFMAGDRDAVEMVQYDQSEDNLYITFKQVKDNLGTFAKFKLLFYKGDQIVDSEDGYFSAYAENLNGNGSTDVASIWAYGIDYDKIEYIFEP